MQQKQPIFNFESAADKLELPQWMRKLSENAHGAK